MQKHFCSTCSLDSPLQGTRVLNALSFLCGVLFPFKFNYPTVLFFSPKKIKVLYLPFFPGGKIVTNFYLTQMFLPDSH